MSIDGALRVLASPREPAALPAPSSKASEGRDAVLEYHKQKAREHAERADEEFQAAEHQYEKARVWHEKFLKGYREHRAGLGPEDAAKMDEMRREEEKRRESEDLMEALRGFMHDPA